MTMRIADTWTQTYEFACHSSACRPPTSGGTGGSTPGTSGHQTISHIRGDIKRERNGILKELQDQGMDMQSNPLVHIFQSRMGNKVAVVRDADGKVVGGVQYELDRTRGYGFVTVTDMRILPKKQGYGTKAFQAIAKIAKEHNLPLRVHGAVSSAKPFYSKLGAVFQTGHNTGDWPKASRNALAAGHPIEGGDFPYDQWIEKDIFDR